MIWVDKASNTKLISEITEVFSKIDPNDKSSFNVAVDRLQKLMWSWEEKLQLLSQEEV